MQNSAQQQMEELTRYITGEILAGVSDQRIVDALVQQGWVKGDAESAVQGVRNKLVGIYGDGISNIPQQETHSDYSYSRDPERDARRAAGMRKILIGSLWLVGGIIVTAVTYAAAANGGTYVVAWGAVLFGFIDIIIGLTMLR
jgi:hypothetical protein